MAHVMLTGSAGNSARASSDLDGANEDLRRRLLVAFLLDSYAMSESPSALRCPGLQTARDFTRDPKLTLCLRRCQEHAESEEQGMMMFRGSSLLGGRGSAREERQWHSRSRDAMSFAEEVRALRECYWPTHVLCAVRYRPVRLLRAVRR